MSSKTFNEIKCYINSAYSLASQTVLNYVHNSVQNAYRKLDQNGSNTITDIAVSFDGTWLTRGHTSQIGIGCVVDTLTGYVIDYDIMSKYCPTCISAKNELGETTAEYDVWYSGTKNSCQINHVGTSGAMEMKAAAKIWSRSEACGFRYTTLLSDGDAKTHKFLNSLKIYGSDVEILKEECINHVSKRLGTSLRNLVKDWRAKGITLRGKSYGSLKERMIKKLTQYYQKAILENKGDIQGMKKSIYATLYYSISTDKNPMHMKCPPGKDSWCFYRRALAKGEKPAPHKFNIGTPINPDYLTKIVPIYQRLASDSLLKGCARCLTQNSNESLHSVIWNPMADGCVLPSRPHRCHFVVAVTNITCLTMSDRGSQNSSRQRLDVRLSLSIALSTMQMIVSFGSVPSHFCGRTPRGGQGLPPFLPSINLTRGLEA
ncbi:uncharacterized protein TNCV_4397041 [Trichonephila clavipes]|nr:uncharacterized protein TNCV_4397041 [Trichonephila clavipes]